MHSERLSIEKLRCEVLKAVLVNQYAQAWTVAVLVAVTGSAEPPKIRLAGLTGG